MSPPLATSQVRYLTTAEVAARYRAAPSTIRYWRHIGFGPKGVKIGGKVLYLETEIERFERELAAQNSEGAEEQLPGHLDANARRVTSHQR